jgi:hypothetical protein
MGTRLLCSEQAFKMVGLDAHGEAARQKTRPSRFAYQASWPPCQRLPRQASKATAAPPFASAQNLKPSTERVIKDL